jgi:hypothetical protein
MRDNLADIHFLFKFDAFAKAAKFFNFKSLKEIEIFKIATTTVKKENDRLYIWKSIDWHVNNVSALILEDILFNMKLDDFCLVCNFQDGELLIAGNYKKDLFKIKHEINVEF